MNPTKRRRSTIEKSEKKLHLDGKKNSFTHFEDLSNEVIYEIFEFLDINHMYQAFSNLNTRFRNLVTHPGLPIKIDLSSMSKSMFLRYYRQIIIPNKHRIRSLRLSNLHLVDRLLSPSFRVKTFVRLETLILDSIESKFFEDSLLYRLVSVFTLRSLVAVLIDPVCSLNTFYRSIFRLPSLKYCKLSFQTQPQTISIRIATNESSPIENLVINSNSNIDHLGPVLSYVPQLRRLSWHTISGLSDEQADN